LCNSQAQLEDGSAMSLFCRSLGRSIEIEKPRRGKEAFLMTVSLELGNVSLTGVGNQ
jgi:hypothetical protein